MPGEDDGEAETLGGLGLQLASGLAQHHDQHYDDRVDVARDQEEKRKSPVQVQGLRVQRYGRRWNKKIKR